ncbi:MAG TPA: hypothetical protein VF501_10310 [Thiobacillus sp.]
MQLQQLTPAEIAFLAAPPADADDGPQRLTRRLAATLSARLRLPVRLHPQPAAPAAAPATPLWQPDAALAALWLARRLGGQHVMGTASFVPRSLIHTLDAALAECGLEIAALAELPPALAWQLDAGGTPAQLALQLPHDKNDMTRWAREVIRHA